MDINENENNDILASFIELQVIMFLMSGCLFNECSIRFISGWIRQNDSNLAVTCLFELLIKEAAYCTLDILDSLKRSGS